MKKKCRLSRGTCAFTVLVPGGSESHRPFIGKKRGSHILCTLFPAKNCRTYQPLGKYTAVTEHMYFKPIKVITGYR